ncbi:hypothetical protein HDV63DRAFT_376667 [Trichoderma sp. SZMC 28014]
MSSREGNTSMHITVHACLTMHGLSLLIAALPASSAATTSPSRELNSGQQAIATPSPLQVINLCGLSRSNKIMKISVCGWGRFMRPPAVIRLGSGFSVLSAEHEPGNSYIFTNMMYSFGVVKHHHLV